MTGYMMPTDDELAESLARARETIAKLAAMPPEQRSHTVNPKFDGPIGNMDAPYYSARPVATDPD